MAAAGKPLVGATIFVYAIVEIVRGSLRSCTCGESARERSATFPCTWCMFT